MAWAIIIQNEQIRTPCQLFDWASTSVPAVHFSNWAFNSFRFPEIQDMCIVPIDVILMIANPRVRRDCIYTQSKKEVIATSEHFLIVNASTD